VSAINIAATFANARSWLFSLRASTRKYKIQEYKITGNTNAGRIECVVMPCSCGQFIHSAHCVRQSAPHSFVLLIKMLRFFPLFVRFIPSLTSEPHRKRSSVHFAFRTYALFRSASRHDLLSLYPLLIVPGRGTPRHFSERSVQSLPFLLPSRK